ncbi:hypothetical protein [Zobellia uliginosa]|uniref:hypothetical protein n=1 Tax=Zobellia uliginosa TaxID=143224 RepID=UPI001C076151|nr:hypothetical protein [Zobellia uliginosa]MBU2947706.1 hypothetical protein [Zobellia uliginosa]
MVDILALCVLEIKDLSFLMASKKLSLWYQSKSPAPNDANLRDYARRSALLLGIKDQNTSCSVDPTFGSFNDTVTLRNITKYDIHFAMTDKDHFTT